MGNDLRPEIGTTGFLQIIPAIEGGPGDAQLDQRTLGREMRAFDKADDLQILTYGICAPRKRTFVNDVARAGLSALRKSHRTNTERSLRMSGSAGCTAAARPRDGSYGPRALCCYDGVDMRPALAPHDRSEPHFDKCCMERECLHS